MTEVNGQRPNGQRKWQLLRSVLSFGVGTVVLCGTVFVVTPGVLDPVVATVCAGLFGIGALEALRKQ